MNDEETFKVTLRMFIEFDLVNQFQIPYKVRFLVVKTYLKREQGLYDLSKCTLLYDH